MIYLFKNKDVIKIDKKKKEEKSVCLSDIKDQVDLYEVFNIITSAVTSKKLLRITSWVLRFVKNIKKKLKNGKYV